ARIQCETALSMHRRYHDREGEAYTLDNLGFIAHRTGNHTQAVDYYRQSLALHRQRGNSYEMAAILDRIGHPLIALGRPEQAGAAWQEALDLYQAQDRTTDAVRLRHQLRAVGPGAADGLAEGIDVGAVPEVHDLITDP
ncbi:MAG TPA: tetratricopeptide repeat protein, partial [Actinophytocola sp.]|uniref:tetratricopeptide repeat protein n=1 Tax=Actinophytocola sp. TaxID=1872138 RepID=UPI002DBB6144